MRDAPIALFASLVLVVSVTGCTVTAWGRAPVSLSARSNVVVSTSQPAAPVAATAPAALPAVSCSIEAGPLWSNTHAQQACPGVCAAAGARGHTGHWWTTRWAEMSVCQCAFDAGTVCAPVDDRPHDQR